MSDNEIFVRRTINKDSYNKIARQWANFRNDTQVSQLVIDFANRIPMNGRVLDVGCGTGRPLTKYLSDQHFHVTGIDASEEMILIAQSMSIVMAEFIVCDFIDFESAAPFDAVLAWDSLWHLPLDEQKSMYRKIASLLCRGGLFLFTHGNVDDEHEAPMMGEMFYYSAISEQAIFEELAANGLFLEFAHRDFVEFGGHRTFVAMAKKV